MSIDVAAFPKPPEWMTAAACLGKDPELFFARKGGSTRAAVRVCETCPVAARCLAWALEHDEQFGVFGGLSPRQRRRLAGRECRRPECGRVAARGRRYCGAECAAAARTEVNARADAKRRGGRAAA